jgi:hypothetical protein
MKPQRSSISKLAVYTLYGSGPQGITNNNRYYKGGDRVFKVAAYNIRQAFAMAHQLVLAPDHYHPGIRLIYNTQIPERTLAPYLSDPNTAAYYPEEPAPDPAAFGMTAMGGTDGD